MKFYGKNEIVWDKENDKELCRFINGEIETSDLRVIKCLKGLNYRSDDNGETEQGNTEGQETQTEQTKKEIMALLDEKNIEYNPRDKKEVLLALLGGD